MNLSYTQISSIYKKIGMLARPLVETQSMLSDFSQSAGIYGWVVKGKIVYIGKTEDFDTRMKTHVSELRRTKSRTGKYSQGLAPEDIEIVILFEIDEVDQTLLSVAEQITIDACGGKANLLNDRNEATYARVMKNIRGE